MKLKQPQLKQESGNLCCSDTGRKKVEKAVACFLKFQLQVFVFWNRRVLLNQVKKWYQLFKTGTGKLLRIVRITEAFPNQQFVMPDDNSQQDPSIYAAVVKKYPGRFFAVYIRNLYDEKVADAQEILAAIKKQNVHTCFFTNSPEAIGHSRKIGLVTK